MNLESFKCEICFNSYPDVIPQSRIVNQVRYYRKYCKKCDSNRRTEVGFNERSPQAKENQKIRDRENQRKIRRSGELTDLAKCIIHDCNLSDQRKNWINDLDYEWVLKTIEQPCFYCGATDIKKSLDRIDNELSHCKKNLICSCVRCNLIRKNMPYEAWLLIVPGVKLAYESGAFKDWNGSGNTLKD